MPVLGNIVNYQPAEPFGSEALAALVIKVHEDGSADLRVANGYCQGWMDVQKVRFSEQLVAGKFSDVGAQPAQPSEE